MFNKKTDEDVFKKKPAKSFKEHSIVLPKKDFRIFANGIDLKLVKGEEIKVPEKYIQNLKTEGVI